VASILYIVHFSRWQSSKLAKISEFQQNGCYCRCHWIHLSLSGSYKDSPINRYLILIQFKPVVAADGLYKREIFRLPDPFAVVTVDGAQTKSTSVIKKTLNPYWNESFDIQVTNSSVIAIQIFDQKKFNKSKTQVFSIVF
jgi:hypothetical protein